MKDPRILIFPWYHWSCSPCLWTAKGPSIARPIELSAAPSLSGRLAGGAPPGLDASDGGAELGVSRNTVLQAYEQLIAEGYATSARRLRHLRRGRAPAARGRSARPRPRRAREVGRGPTPLRASAVSSRRNRAAPGVLEPAPRPRDDRLPLRRAALRRPPARDLGAAPRPARAARSRSAPRLPAAGRGERAPRGARRITSPARAASCAPPIRSSSCTARSRRSTSPPRLLVDPGDLVVLEEPHYTGFSFCLTALGAEVAFVPADEQGLRVDDLAGSVRGAPRLRDAVPPVSRRRVLSLAAPPRGSSSGRAGCGAYVLEDDYDGGSASKGVRSNACKLSTGMDGSSTRGTASKLLFPALRIGWLVAPAPLAPCFQAAKALADTGTATLEQLAFADFIAEGHLERWITRRSRMRHAARRRALIEAVARDLGDRCAHLRASRPACTCCCSSQSSGRATSRALGPPAASAVSASTRPPPFYARAAAASGAPARLRLARRASDPGGRPPFTRGAGRDILESGARMTTQEALGAYFERRGIKPHEERRRAVAPRELGLHDVPWAPGSRQAALRIQAGRHRPRRPPPADRLRHDMDRRVRGSRRWELGSGGCDRWLLYVAQPSLHDLPGSPLRLPGDPCRVQPRHRTAAISIASNAARCSPARSKSCAPTR